MPIGIEGDVNKVKASSSFLKKRTKKLLIPWARTGSNGHPNRQKFLLLFSKRSAFSLPKEIIRSVPMQGSVTFKSSLAFFDTRACVLQYEDY
jgi:hypothetical protein